MSNRPDQQRYPSIEEFGGWYNLGYDRYDGSPVLQSRDWVPDFEHGEFYELWGAEHQWFDQLVLESDRKPFDVLAEPPFYLVSDADDRTLHVDADYDYVTVDLVRRIQQEFLSRYPLWRVLLCLEDISCSIMIYPDAIRYGNFPLGTDPHEALRELLPRAVAFRDKRLRPQRAEVAFLQQRLPDAVREIGDRPFLVLGVLYHNEIHQGRLVVCLLIRGPDDLAVDVDGPRGTDNDFMWSSWSYGVNGDGSIIGRSEIPESAPFCVGLRLPPGDYRGPLTIVERATGKRHAYEVKSEDIVQVNLQE